MRLWSIHPKYLDRVGLIALWREGLLAQKVLEGLTRGYVHHPQLIRFKSYSNPLLAIGTYLYYVYLEGVGRGYRFVKEKIRMYNVDIRKFIPVTRDQAIYELKLLIHKCERRDPVRAEWLKTIEIPELNPVFRLVEGSIADWEKPKEYVLNKPR
ncbi:MAG: pyrimidine dimer DNA glycosylase/endonuclease V [Desulfurococcaceae archaeon]